MKTLIRALVLGCCCQMAWAAPNCADVETFAEDDKAIDTCLKQTNDELNYHYEQLQKRYKSSKEKTYALINMQIAWLALRDAQCDLAGYNASMGRGPLRTAQRCSVKMTLKRTEELKAMQ